MLTQNKLSFTYLYKNPMGTLFCLVVDALTAVLFFRRRSFPQKIRNILIIKPDHMGDMVLCLGAIKCIHQQYPDATIQVLHHPQTKYFLDLLKFPVVKHPISHYKLDRSNKSKMGKVATYLNDVLRTLSTLRKSKIDLAVNFRAFGPNMAWLPLLSGAKYSVSHGTAGFRFFNDRIANWKENIHEIQHHQEILSLIGIQVSLELLIPKFEPVKFDSNSIRGFNFSETFTLIHPGAGDLKKMISPDAWHNVLSTDKLQGRILIIGLPKELAPFYSYDFGRDVTIIDNLNMSELCIAINSARYVYCLDSLVMHLTWAYDKPATVIFRNADPAQWAPLSEKIQWRVYENSTLD